MTMKKLIGIFSVLLLFAAISCTQNDGNIGKLFGAWYLDSMIVDGEPAELPEGTATFMKFQGEVVQFMLSDCTYVPISQCYGTWTRSMDNISFDFTHSSDAYLPGTGVFEAPQWLGFPANKVFTVSLAHLGSERLDMVYVREDGSVAVYKFLKTW